MATFMAKNIFIDAIADTNIYWYICGHKYIYWQICVQLVIARNFIVLIRLVP